MAGLRGTSPWLEQQFDDAADRAVRSLESGGVVDLESKSAMSVIG